MRNNIYISYFFDKRTGQPIEPICVWQRAKNKADAKYYAYSYLSRYYDEKGRGSDFLNKLKKNTTIIVK